MTFATAAAIAADIQSGKASATKVTTDCLARMEAAQKTLNPFVTISRDSALRTAAAIDAQAPLRDPVRHPLAGVPFTVKDNIETLGVRTTYGSRTLENSMPEVEAVAVTRMRNAGGVLVGKTTLPEFASTLLAHSPLTGVTHNPWNPAMTPGGSSSGAAAAVAAGLGPIALTTDAGASTRLPAALCGVLGLKPTRGLIPYELFPDGFGNFIHMGLITRTVADLALALDVVSGEDPRDPQSIGVRPTQGSAALEQPLNLRGQRIRWRPLMGNSALDDEVRELCEQTLDALRGHGATVNAYEAPYESPGPTWKVLQQVNWAGRFGMPAESDIPRMDPGFVAGVKGAHATGGMELAAALYRRSRFFRLVQEWFQEIDWLATPVTTVAGLPGDAAGDTKLEINGKPAGEVRLAWAPYLNLFNFSGHPALSVPAGFTRAGLPVGIQLIGPLFSDVNLLRLARIIETIRPWANRTPPGM